MHWMILVQNRDTWLRTMKLHPARHLFFTRCLSSYYLSLLHLASTTVFFSSCCSQCHGIQKYVDVPVISTINSWVIVDERNLCCTNGQDLSHF